MLGSLKYELEQILVRRGLDPTGFLWRPRDGAWAGTKESQAYATFDLSSEFWIAESADSKGRFSVRLLPGVNGEVEDHVAKAWGETLGLFEVWLDNIAREHARGSAIPRAKPKDSSESSMSSERASGSISRREAATHGTIRALRYISKRWTVLSAVAISGFGAGKYWENLFPGGASRPVVSMSASVATVTRVSPGSVVGEATLEIRVVGGRAPKVRAAVPTGAPVSGSRAIAAFSIDSTIALGNDEGLGRYRLVITASRSPATLSCKPIEVVRLPVRVVVDDPRWPPIETEMPLVLDQNVCAKAMTHQSLGGSS